MALALSLETEPAPRLASVDALVLAFRWRPRMRAHCVGVPRPCVFVGCRMNTFLDILPNGDLRMNHPGLEPDEVPAESSCVLDLAANEGMTWDDIGPALGMSRARAQQIGYEALEKVRRLKVLQ